MREPKRTSAAFAAGTTPSLDCVFDLLSDRRRRYTLYYLYEQDDGVATVSELADHVEAIEREIESETASVSLSESEATVTERTRRIQTELRHVHLPKLEEVGVLEHDQRSETARYWAQPSLEEWLEHARHKEL